MVADAERSITRIMECLVLSFELDPAAATFTLVTDYPEKPAGADRTFIAMRFHGVRDFAREKGNLARLQGFVQRYSIGGTPPIVVQGVMSTEVGDGRRFALWLGPNFGGISFRYAQVSGFLRHSQARELDGDWVYRDLSSGEMFDFTCPFADQHIDKTPDQQ